MHRVKERRLGKVMIKVRGDKHGPAGQWVRVLLRQATTADILLEKPAVPLQPKGHIFDRYMHVLLRY
jgi:hypothetical protein